MLAGAPWVNPAALARAEQFSRELAPQLGVAREQLVAVYQQQPRLMLHKSCGELLHKFQVMLRLSAACDVCCELAMCCTGL